MFWIAVRPDLAHSQSTAAITHRIRAMNFSTSYSAFRFLRGRFCYRRSQAWSGSPLTNVTSTSSEKFTQLTSGEKSEENCLACLHETLHENRVLKAASWQSYWSFSLVFTPTVRVSVQWQTYLHICEMRNAWRFKVLSKRGDNPANPVLEVHSG